MRMLRKIGRLFVIKTRIEAWFVIYAIALGAVERGRHYLDVYPGSWGYALALACTGVVFLAGAKLLDSVRPEPAVERTVRFEHQPRRKRQVTRSRPRAVPTGFGSGSRTSLRKD